MKEPRGPLVCPVPIEAGTIQLAHGGGGSRTRRLLDEIVLPAFDSPSLAARHDSAVFDVSGARLAFTTDAYVVSPLFFPGGDIGRLAVFGTVNDLAMAGAMPRALSAAFILEEGLPIETFRRVVASMRAAADEAGVSVVTGDTKVVDRGKGDGIYVTTSGVGVVSPRVDIGPHRVNPGDVVLVSGDLGRHGIAILSVRQGLAFEAPIASDCAPLHTRVAALLDRGVVPTCLRDLTRGGLAAALHEIARDAAVAIEIDELAVPVTEAVGGACELLGLDPLYVANEGTMVVFAPADHADRCLEVLREHPLGRMAARVGRVLPSDGGSAGSVVVRTPLGSRRVVDLLTGEQLPRIC
jgi:hydrogenase expression/formation protein HypE